MFAGMREEALESGNGLLPMLWVIFDTSPKVMSRGFWYSVLPDSVFSAVFRLAVSIGSTYLLLWCSGIPRTRFYWSGRDAVKTDVVSQYYHQATAQW